MAAKIRTKPRPQRPRFRGGSDHFAFRIRQSTPGAGIACQGVLVAPLPSPLTRPVKGGGAGNPESLGSYSRFVNLRQGLISVKMVVFARLERRTHGRAACKLGRALTE